MAERKPKVIRPRKPNEPEWSSFGGYSRPGWTMVPHEILDYHLAFLTGNEVKALLYLARKTFGWQGKREGDRVSLNQMLRGVKKRDGTQLDYGVGMSRAGLIAALDVLEDRRLIRRDRHCGARGHEPTVYSLHVEGDVADADPSLPSGLGVAEDLKPSTPSGRGLVRPADEASTPSGQQQKKLRQEISEQKKEPPPPTPQGEQEELPVEDEKPEDRVWLAYLAAISEFGLHPNEYRFTEKRRKLIRNLLRDRPLEDLLEAVHGWLYSAPHTGRNDRQEEYIELETVLSVNGQRDNVEKFRNLNRQARAEGWAILKHIPKKARGGTNGHRPTTNGPARPSPSASDAANAESLAELRRNEIVVQSQ